MRKTSFTYFLKKTPKYYICSQCKVTNVKLWREWQNENINLTCVDCSLKAENKYGVVNEDGSYFDASLGFPHNPGFSIGYKVLAIPLEDFNNAYHSYGNMPDEGFAWWKGLLLRKA